MDPITGLGAILGGLAGLGQKWLEHKQRMEELAFQATEAEKDRSHEKEVLQVELEKTRLNNAAAFEQKQLELQGQLEDAATRLQIASFENDSAKYATAAPDNKFLQVVDIVRGLTRPVLTLLLVIAMICLISYLLIKHGSVLEKAEVMELMKASLEDLRFAAVTATGWWFGSRALTSKGRK